MLWVRRLRWLGPLISAIGGPGGAVAQAQAIVNSGQGLMEPLLRDFELADAVQLDRADHAVLANFQRARAYLAAGQWSEAVETVRQVAGKLGRIAAGCKPQPLCQRPRLLQSPHHALSAGKLGLYRRRIDPAQPGMKTACGGWTPDCWTT